MDAANLLKPMLARGELRCIGATTIGEYRQHMEKDAAFERRFQQVRHWYQPTHRVIVAFEQQSSYSVLKRQRFAVVISSLWPIGLCRCK